jgi:hypothetical protein
MSALVTIKTTEAFFSVETTFDAEAVTGVYADDLWSSFSAIEFADHTVVKIAKSPKSVKAAINRAKNSAKKAAKAE